LRPSQDRVLLGSTWRGTTERPAERIDMPQLEHRDEPLTT